MPFRDPDAAADFVFKYLPQIPFWPQLPRRDIREGMVCQFSESLPCLKVTADGFFFDGQESEKELEVFYDRIISGDIEHFRISRAFAEGLYSFHEKLKLIDLSRVEFIKGHVTGPFTFAASVNNKEGVALLHDEIFMQAIIKGLAMKGQWQVKFFRPFNKKIIIFIDEPYLAGFGSAFTSLSRETVVAGLKELVGALKAEDVLTGVHCCGNTDWSIFTEIPGLDIINFDAFGFADKLVLYAENLKGFLKKGGILCWGISPTADLQEFPSSVELARKIEEGIKALVKKGVNESLVRENLLLSPSCGLGTLNETKAVTIFSALAEVSATLK